MNIAFTENNISKSYVGCCFGPVNGERSKKGGSLGWGEGISSKALSACLGNWNCILCFLKHF